MPRKMIGGQVRRIATLASGTLAALFVVAAPVGTAATSETTTVIADTMLAEQHLAAGVRTFAYHANGRLAGWVRREGPRSWWASDGGGSAIHADRKGGYGITEGLHAYAYAWPARPGQRNRYVVLEGPGRPSRTNSAFKRVTATRWNILEDGRMVAFTKGPDGVAAALGYYKWGDELLPD